ncbi:MAG: response regulator [Candidatus Lokiarchaeota archaeon]|nr:response regulator [Candidatus Lokiarchaeota archaeon]MBD3200365.1 response regulator [Candidatus Lokiarchaeota archaeon]
MSENTTEKKRILIVDDEPDILNLTTKFLELGNYETLTSSNGKEAMKIIEQKYDQIDLVLLDIMMPGRSGYSVLEEIKTTDKYKDITVVLFTVKSFNEDIQKGKRLGADYYITKPFSGKELLKKINEILNN